ncbi:T9SS-dependent choice-of-anchor J family protein [Flavobacterium terrigena]|uniref:Por secretion system C-terminal sorting domain-containing protein n=1 Tax=Flavobacterium terrigena TaxID=402734 RepID=A0A1H6USX8_9FLAO|nr:choice-of-anchor J domain-containing protein [Flavobacterium terrigena]SEI95338.1 Por secretion system C-terminal sorting domain-containing protein [Flavobacterium terrigena]
MKKITLWLFALFTCWQISAQTGTIVVGVSDGTPNTITGYPSPMQDFYKTGRAQYLYTASELTNAGFVAGNITEIGWVVTSNNTSTLQEGYKISMKNTASTVLTSTFESGATLVYGPTNFTPSTTGNVMFTLSTPFVWDGTSNVIVEVCAGVSTGTISQNVSCANNTTVGIKSVYYRNDASLSPCTATTGTTINERPLLVATGNVASCLAPTNVVSANVGAFTADISWTASTSNPGIGYEYVVSTSNAAPTGAGTATTNTSVSVSSLLEQTTYYIYVRSNCNAGEFSGWYGPISFTTTCGPVTAPMLEPFATFLPNACWFNRTGGDLTTGPIFSTALGWFADGFGNVGTTGAIKNEIFTTGANDWFISPVITIPATGYELKFDAAATQYNSVNAPTNAWEADDTIEVLVSTTGITNWTVLHTYNDTNQPSNVGTPNIIDLDAYAGQNVRIAFRAVEGSTNGSADIDFSIDNFQVRLTPACSEPMSIITANATDSTIDVSWTAPATAPSNGYEYFVSTSNTVPVTAGTPVANTYAIPSGLLSNTTYYIFVRSNCDAAGFSSWTGPVSFTTACGVYPAPMTENFGTFLPSVCWFNRTGGDLTTGPTSLTGSGWVADGFANVGTTGAIRNEIFTTGGNDWIISPRIGIPTTGYELKFDAAATQFGNVNIPTNAWEADDTIEVLVSTTGLTNWTVLHTYNDTNQPSNSGTSNILDLDAYAGSDIRIAFRAVEGSTNGSADIDFSIDNFQVRLTPACSEPIGIVFGNVTDSSVDMSWTAPATAPSVGYEYIVSTSNTIPVIAGTPVTTSYASASGLLSNTTYYIFVRSDCGASGFSEWSGPVTFTTPCGVYSVPMTENFATFLPSVCWFNRTGGDLTTGPTSSTALGWFADGFANVGTTGAIRNEIYTTGANDWIISPRIAIPAAGYELKFDAAATQFATVNAPTNAWESDDSIEVLVSTTELTNWTVLHTYNNTNQPSNTGTPNILDLDAYAGQNIRIAFRAVEGATNGSADIDFSIDNFQIRLTPSCIEPLNLIFSTVTSTTASISWDATSPSPTTGYEYFVSTTNTVPVTAGTATTNTYASLSSLLPQTTYYVFVRSDCSAGDFSYWTGPITFTTQCAPINTLPWNEGFEGLATVGSTVYPPCWYKQNGDWTSANASTTYSTANTGTRYIRNSYAAANEYIWTPGFDLVAGTSYDFSSFVQGDNATGWVVDYVVNSAQNSTGATQIGASYNVPGVGTPYSFQPYAKVTRSFVPATSGTYYFAVRVNQPGFPWYVSFDDFKLELSPSTPPTCATNLVATPNACGNFSNNLNWNVEPTANGYYVTIGTTPGGTDIANAVNVGSNSYAFTGSIGTTYFWSVVPYNGAGAAIGCTEQSFSTAAVGCYCTSVPTSNDGLGITTALVGATSNAVPDVTYANLTAVPEVVTQGSNTNIQLTFSTGFVYNINVWVDFNNDYDFNDAGELVKTGIACTTVQPNTVDASFTMPLTAPIGQHRMRIGSAWTAQNPPNPCYNGSYGIVLDFTVDTAILSSNSFDTTTFVAYPNPVKDVLNLSYKSAISNVRVVNLLGQEVLNTKTNANDLQVDMSALTAGAYIVNITVEDTVHTIKVIKE